MLLLMERSMMIIFRSLCLLTFISSSGAQSRKQGDKTENKDKGKSLVVTITGFRDLNAEFEECTNNSSNGVNAASFSVSTAGHNFINKTNDFSDAGPSNATMPNVEDLTHSNDADDVGVEADINNLESIFQLVLFQQPESKMIIQPLKLLAICLQLLKPEVWQEQFEIKVEYYRCLMKTFILACLLVFFHKRNPNESIKLLRIQVGLKPCKKSSFSSKCRSLDLS
uniref:Uncharacterized protein n=1 Tax=Tanacetum cinerariifolium TaxID=118510 RepID=A0A699H8T8_TANCI|nr:hypothetical protein [Tanacetum cinerariifolium]